MILEHKKTESHLFLKILYSILTYKSSFWPFRFLFFGLPISYFFVSQRNSVYRLQTRTCVNISPKISQSVSHVQLSSGKLRLMGIRKKINNTNRESNPTTYNNVPEWKKYWNHFINKSFEWKSLTNKCIAQLNIFFLITYTCRYFSWRHLLLN